jgi:hypothetical protein
MSVNKVISLSKRAKDEEKPFFEQLLQEGARNLLFNRLNKKVKPWLSRRIEKRRQLTLRPASRRPPQEA